MMRIITGSARGAKLQAPAGENTRPTAERTKEAIFSMLQGRFEGRRVLDLFAGSGQMGLEAVSRGATYALLLDHDKNAVAVINQNAKHTKLSDKVEVRMGEALSFLKTYCGAPFSLIFLDPPYRLGLLPDCLALIAERGLLTEGGVVICESGDGKVFADKTELATRYRVDRESRYGAAFVTILSLNEQGSDA